MNTEQSRSKHYILIVFFTCLLVMLDQFSKYLVIGSLKDKPAFVIIQNVFQLEYLENRGAAFGLLQNQKIFFLISAVVITIAVVWFFLHVPIERHYLPLEICAVFILAGAWGNGIDRLIRGYVVDFFYFILIDFPIFNVADIYLTVSVLVLVILLLAYYKEDDLERILHNRKSGR